MSNRLILPNSSVSSVKPKIVKSVHFSEKKDQFVYRNYRDETSVLGIPTGASYPTVDDQGIYLLRCFPVRFFYPYGCFR